MRGRVLVWLLGLCARITSQFTQQSWARLFPTHSSSSTCVVHFEIYFVFDLGFEHCGRVLARNYRAPKCCPERILLRAENARSCSEIAC
jgi:hypothetical protein